MLARIVGRSFSRANNIRSAKFSTETTPAVPVVKSGGGFFDRFFGFLVGAGTGFGVSFYFIEEELTRSNAAITRSINELNARVSQLEK
jgi:hypothetical protein